MILARLKLWLLAAFAGAVALLTMQAKWRKEGHDEARREAAEAQNRRVAKGEKAAEQAREARRKGRSPEDGVRSRDRRWR